MVSSANPDLWGDSRQPVAQTQSITHPLRNAQNEKGLRVTERARACFRWRRRGDSNTRPTDCERSI
jgi:hypothetical protein